MNKTLTLITKSFLSTVLIFNALDVFAQSEGGSGNMFVYVLVVVGVFILLWALMQVSDNLLQIENKRHNVDTQNSSFMAGFSGMFSKGLPAHLAGKEVHVLKRGYDIKLEGAPSDEVHEATSTTRFAVQPGNWRGNAPIPKMLVAPGDNVKAGDPLFFDKSKPDIKYVAPVSGEVIEVNRGAKRAISEVVILADREISFREMNAPNIDSASREEIVSFMFESGGWSHLRQRPIRCRCRPVCSADECFHFNI